MHDSLKQSVSRLVCVLLCYSNIFFNLRGNTDLIHLVHICIMIIITYLFDSFTINHTAIYNNIQLYLHSGLIFIFIHHIHTLHNLTFKHIPHVTTMVTIHVFKRVSGQVNVLMLYKYSSVYQVR